MIPRRTIRVVLWTNEELGLHGGRQYAVVGQNSPRARCSIATARPLGPLGGGSSRTVCDRCGDGRMTSDELVLLAAFVGVTAFTLIGAMLP